MVKILVIISIGNIILEECLLLNSKVSSGIDNSVRLWILVLVRLIIKLIVSINVMLKLVSDLNIKSNLF